MRKLLILFLVVVGLFAIQCSVSAESFSVYVEYSHSTTEIGLGFDDLDNDYIIVGGDLQVGRIVAGGYIKTDIDDTDDMLFMGYCGYDFVPDKDRSFALIGTIMADDNNQLIGAGFKAGAEFDKGAVSVLYVYGIYDDDEGSLISNAPYNRIYAEVKGDIYLTENWGARVTYRLFDFEPAETREIGFSMTYRF